MMRMVPPCSKILDLAGGSRSVHGKEATERIASPHQLRRVPKER
jgi:hypothetical protein